MTKVTTSPEVVASQAWTSMRAFVAANDRRRELQEALSLGRGLGRVKLLVLLNQGALTLSEIADAAGVDAPYATVVVDKLVRRGWALRTAHPDDHRRKLVSLTPAGRTASALVAQILAEPPGALLELTASDLADLRRIMAKLEAALSGAL